ncbi:hypothetical protein L0Y65_06535, partial [Candidatus Micrarchaeota archaeon]|nr:hypothetical protein [Candidatus Micrarchaeota archaeon]
MPVLLVLAFAIVLAASFGCIQQPSDGSAAADAFGENAEALNARIASADTAVEIANLTSEVAALRAEAQNDSRFASFLMLLDAQDLTLQVLLAYAEFQEESAKIGTSGIDCGKDYSSFISRMKAANATAASASSKARAYISTNQNSTAGMLIGAINRTGPDMMAFYASLLDDNVRTDCPAKSQASAEYALPLSYEDALSIAISEAGDGFFVYGAQSPLPAGTVITAPRALDDVNFTLSGSTWFFFLDSEPWAPFAHDARYVMIDVSGGSYLVANESMHPQIDGVPRWKSIDERSDPANILYPLGMEDLFSLPANLSSAPYAHRLYAWPLAGPDLSSLNAGRDVNALECCPDKKKYALIMTGSNDTQFQANTNMMYEFLKGSGYGDGDIQYLSTNAAAAGSDGVTSVATLTAALNWMKANAKCCDEVFMYLAGHGSKDPVFQVRHKTTNATKWVRSVAALGDRPGDWERTGETGDYHKIDVNGGNPGGGGASSQILVTYLKDIPSCKITVMYQSCHSGAAAPTLAGVPGVTVLTPVDSEHSSYGISEATGDWKVGSFFTQAYLNAKTKNNATADADRDGSVSEKEAFDHANQVNHDAIEEIRTSLNNLAANETNLTRKQALQRRARELQEQRGVFKEGGPCICCHVNCSAETNYICKIFNGTNQPNCPDCKKVGDYCGPDLPPGQQNETPPTSGNQTGANQTGGNQTGTNQTGANGTGGEQPPAGNMTAVCGDGNITGAETCDHGSYATNKCPEGTYCNKCGCKKLETSVVCGDGKISSPDEDCDGGNVDYKICQTGYTCSICKCVPAPTQCGDGTVTPPEECDHGNTYTNECPGGKTCHSCKCLNPDDVPGEAYCGNNKREGAEQ